MTSITIDMDSSAVNAALARLGQRVTDLTFRDAQAPYGNPWQELKQARRDGSSKPLRELICTVSHGLTRF